MKHKLILLAVIMATAIPTTVSAQLKVASDGAVYVASGSPQVICEYGLYSQLVTAPHYLNAALCGEHRMDTTPTYSTIGVLGMGRASDGTHNYGIAGICSSGSGNFAAVYGSSDILSATITGKYAGYFSGSTKVVGTLSATEYVTTSDIRLKDNVISLKDYAQGSTLKNVMDMDVITYNLKLPKSYTDEDLKQLSKEYSANEIEALKGRDNAINEQKHFGLSAQDLQKIYPELVREGQDGYLAVNYTELVPILIRSIQELKQELDEVRGAEAAPARSAAAAIRIATAANGNVLYQNTPNPFKEKTTIRFSLASSAQNAVICIFDMSGKLIKRLPISQGESSVSVNGYELGEGMFLYSLLVNGQEVDTKRMIITK